MTCISRKARPTIQKAVAITTGITVFGIVNWCLLFASTSPKNRESLRRSHQVSFSVDDFIQTSKTDVWDPLKLKCVLGLCSPKNGGKGTKSDHPELPDGATLVQFTPCKQTGASIPLVVNKHWNGSDTATSAYISQHGSSLDPENYYSILENYIDVDQSVLVAPGLYQTSSREAPKSFYESSRNLAWQSGIDSWPAGRDAVGPKTGRYKAKGAECSSYDVYDSLLKTFADKSRFPKLQNVYLVGHSGGANLISRFSQLYDDSVTDSLHLRFIIANAANQAYFTDARPWLNTDNCKEAFSWPYQLVNSDGKMPRYVSERFSPSASYAASRTANFSEDLRISQNVFEKWLERDVILLIGDEDTSTSGTQSCMSKAQGGPARRDRNYAYWAMQNLLAHTDTDVSDWFGYSNLTSTGAGKDDQWESSNTAIVSDYSTDRWVNDEWQNVLDLLEKVLSKQRRDAATLKFSHQVCVVEGVAHDANGIYKSSCGKSALQGNETLPAGAAPRRPTNREDIVRILKELRE